MTNVSAARALGISFNDVTAYQDVQVQAAERALGLGHRDALNILAAEGAAVAVPGAPTIGTATPQAGAKTSVAFTPPGSDGGSLITSYTVTSSPGGITGTGTSSPIVVTGLTPTTSYTFTVRATNEIGQGTASAASNAAVTLA